MLEGADASPVVGRGERPLDPLHADPDGALERRQWFFRGVRGTFSTPAFVLMAATFGFGGLARASGFTLGQSVLMTGWIWALPSQVVLVGAIASGAGLLAAAIAVTLSAVRLLPMTVALMPILRGPATPRLTLMLLSHFIAVTAWVEGMARLPKLPRAARVPYFAGFGATLVLLNMVTTGAGHAAAGALPPLLSAGLLMLTPAYFIITLTNAASTVAERAAMGLGLVMGPLAYFYLPGPDLLWSGLTAGTLAYLIDRGLRARAAP